MPKPLQLQLFGTPQISYLGQPLSGFVSGKVRALLIYLAVTARPQSRDHLAEFFWADTPASSRVNLRKALSNLRGLVGDVLREDGKESILLDPQQVWVDVIEFAQLVKQERESEALQLYHADFLSGFNFSLSYEFETWALSEQSRLKTQFVDLLRRLAAQQEANQKLGEAISTVRHLLQLEPWHEEAHRWLMELLARDGQRSAALAHFEIAKRVLREELEVAPNEETLKLLAKIQRSVDAPAKPRPKTSSIPKPEFPLIGREQELQTIQSAWEKCLQAGPHFVCIAGEAGIGKTRLTEEVRLWVGQQGYATAYARSYAAEGSLAYSPVVDWLRSEAIRSSLEQLEPVWLNEVARLLPELLVDHPHLSPPKPIRDGTERRLFFEALSRAVCGVQQPILLVIDDLQWCDRETLEWLRFLLRFEARQSLLIIGAYRIEEVDREHALQKLLFELRRNELIEEIELGMLSNLETIKLINTVTSDHVSNEQMGEWWKTTSGHPLFVIESVRSQGGPDAPDTVPRKVQNVIQSRLANLSSEARHVVSVAATIGHAFSLELLTAAAQLDYEISSQLLDELWTRRIIQAKDQGEYDFSHDRIREVVYSDIPPFRRQTLHKQIAQALETIFQPNLSPIFGELGAHYEQAGMLESAMRCYKQATINARQLYAHNDLVLYFGKTIATLRQLPNRNDLAGEEIDLLVDLGLALILVYGFGAKSAGDAWHEAYELAAKQGTKFQQCRALLGLDMYYNNLGEMYKARTYSEKSYELAKEDSDIFLRQQTLTNYGAILYHFGEVAQSLPYFEEMLAIHKPGLDPSFVWLHHDASTNALVRSAKSLWFLGYPDQARLRCEKALDLARKDFELFTLSAALDFSGMVYSFCQDYASVKRIGEELIALAAKYVFPYYGMIGTIYVDWAEAQQGIMDATEKMTKHMREFFAINRTRKFAPQRNAMWAEVLLQEGKPDHALSLIDDVLNRVEKSGNIYFKAHLFKVKGDSLLAMNHDEAAIEAVYQQSLDFARKQAARSFELRASVSLARLWQSQGKHAEAYQLLAPIYGWFTEGFDTVDLVEARLLLGELTIDQS